MKTISTFLIAILVFGFLFLALPEKGYSGVSIPGGPPCCQTQNFFCHGGSPEAEDLCIPQCIDAGTCVFFENAVCVEDEENPSMSECKTIPQNQKTIPVLSGWGFISLAIVFALIGLGALLLKRRKTTA